MANFFEDGTSDYVRMGVNAMKNLQQQPQLDFSSQGNPNISSYFQPSFNGYRNDLTPPGTEGVSDIIKKAISDGGNLVSEGLGKIRDLASGGSKEGPKFGQLQEFEQPQILNKEWDPAKDDFGSGTGVFDGYFKTGELDRLNNYEKLLADIPRSAAGAVDYSDPGNSNWRTSDQIEKAREAQLMGDTSYKTPDKEFDWGRFAQTLASIKVPQQQQLSHSGRVGGGFRFDKSQYQNPLIQREYEQLYTAPLYNKLV